MSDNKKPWKEEWSDPIGGGTFTAGSIETPKSDAEQRAALRAAGYDRWLPIHRRGPDPWAWRSPSGEWFDTVDDAYAHLLANVAPPSGEE